jgi:hypothetical protein
MRLILLGALVSVLALLVAAGVKAQTTATATIQPDGVIIDGGGAALVFVVVECTLDPGDELLEGFVSLSQEATSGMGGLNPTCDGKPHRNVVRVQALDGNFHSGDAFASAFLLFLDPETGATVQAQDSRTITLRGPKAR